MRYWLVSGGVSHGFSLGSEDSELTMKLDSYIPETATGTKITRGRILFHNWMETGPRPDLLLCLSLTLK